jgi:dipeptidyl aminopeptidase/acylaminoacyl peptidase
MTIRSFAAGAVGCLLLSSPAFAAHPMTIADLIGAVRVGDPQLSPDGKTVAYVRTTTDVKTGKRNADIWIVPADGSSAPKLLIGGPAGDDTPRWAPDGRHVAFISSRGGDPQVYIADADGSNARKLTSVSGGAQSPMMYSPDGTMIAFVADVKITPDPPVHVHKLTRLLYRHWTDWRENLRHHVFIARTAGGVAKDVTPGDFDAPPMMQEDGGIAFTPDNRELVFVSNHEGNDREAWTTNNDIWSVPVAGGTAKKLTKNPAADHEPVFTPDGKSMIVRAQRRPGFESDRWYLDVYDRATGQKRTVFESPDLSVSEFTLSRDGGTIVFSAPSNGTDNLYRVPVAGGTPQEISKGGSISSAQIGPDFAVFSRATMNSPAEIFRQGRTGAAQPLTHENAAWLKDVQFEKPESATVAGAGGTPIQYWIVKPPAFNPSRKYPVVFMIHGGPQGDWGDAWSFRWNPALWAAQGWVVIAPNPRGSFGFGQKFVDDISQDWGGKAMGDLTAVFDAAVTLPYVDPAKQGIAGASYGGYAVDWLITQTNRFKVAVSHDGVFNLESMALATEEEWFVDWEFGGPPLSAKARANYAKWSPSRYAENIKTPTLVITNEQDFRVPVDQGLQLFTALRRNGVPSEALVFSDEGHWVLKALDSQYWHESVFSWIKKYLGN